MTKKKSMIAKVQEGFAVEQAVRKAIKNKKKRERKKAKKLEGGGLYTGSGKYNLLKSTSRFSRALGGIALSKLAGGGLYTGSGAYFGESGHEPGSSGNNLMGGFDGWQQSVPKFRTAGDETGATTLSHEEYIGDIYGPGQSGGAAIPFSSTVYRTNPGLGGFLRWAAQVCCNFDEYKINQLVYRFKSSVTDIGSSTTGQSGMIVMSYQYNPSAAPYKDKLSMLEYAHSASAKITKDCVLGVECDPKKTALAANFLFTRSSYPTGVQDLKTYDPGFLNLALVGAPSAYNGLPVGELWVTYSITVRKPKLFAALCLNSYMDAFYQSPVLAGGAMTTLNRFFGALGTKTFLSGQANSIGGLLTPGSDGVTPVAGAAAGCYTFPASFTGPVRVTLQVYGVGIAGLLTGAPIAGCNIQKSYDMLGASGVFTYTQSSVVGTYAQLEQHYFVSPASNGVNNILQFIGGNSAVTNYTSAYLKIDGYNQGNGGSVIADEVTNPLFVSSTGVVVTPV